MKKSHSDEIILSLLDDDLFVQWVIDPTPELDALWKQKADNSNELRDCINDLKNIINRIKLEEPSLSADDKKLIWEKIEQGIVSERKKKKIFTGIWSRIAAAAVIVGMLVGGYLYIFTGSLPAEVDYLSMIDGARPSQSGNISLILSENKVVDIPNDSSNVVYDHTGKVNVDSEAIEGTGNDKPSLNQLIVPYGKTTSLTLSDGTKIWVNSGTKLIYPSVFGKDKREIFLVGEVYLDVIKNEDCPFIIKTNHMDVNVLGTKLNVSAYNDESIQSVVLVSGAVSIRSKDLKGTYNIYPSQMFSYGTASNKADIREVDVNNYISWIYGYLLLQSESLDRVLQKLERHFNISFTYNTDDFRGIYVSGKLDLKGTPENALKYISITVPISYKVDNENIRIELNP